MTGSDVDVGVQCVNLALFPAGIWEIGKCFANSPSFDTGQCLSQYLVAQYVGSTLLVLQ
jgi:hypothetical protein